MERLITIFQVLFLSFLTGALIWSAKNIAEIRAQELRQNRALIECFNRIDDLGDPREHQTFNVLAMPALNDVPENPPKTELGPEGSVEDLDKTMKDFPKVEEPEESDDSDPYQVGSEVQTAQSDVWDWAGPNVSELPVIR